MKVKLGDTEYTLSLNLNALVKFEQVTGKPITEAFKGLQATDLRALLWACIQENVTLEEVGEKITLENIQYIADALSELFGGQGPFPFSG